MSTLETCAHLCSDMAHWGRVMPAAFSISSLHRWPTAMPRFDSLQFLNPHVVAIPCGLLTTMATLQIVAGTSRPPIQRLATQGIANRDIKCENTLLALRDDGRMDVKLCDFGLSKRFTGNVHQAQTLVGSPFYVPPEVSVCFS